MAKLQDLATDVLQSNPGRIVEPDNEEPVLFMTIHENGLPIFQRSFTGEWKATKTVMISGLLSALQSFGKEIFERAGTIERIKYQDMTVVVQSNNPFLFCYTFRGQSYSSMKKVARLIEKIKDNTQWFSQLVNNASSGPRLDEDKEQRINQLVREIFE